MGLGTGQFTDNDDIRLKGATDNALIGNTSDRLKVDPGQVFAITTQGLQYYLQQNQLYSAAVDLNQANSGSDNPLIYFQNPAGSGKIVYLQAVLAGTTVTNVQSTFCIYADPTVSTNGSALSSFARNRNNGQPAASSLLTKLPTVTILGSLIESVNSGQNNNSVVMLGNNFSFALQPNSTFLLTGNPASNNRNATLSIVWSEIPV